MAGPGFDEVGKFSAICAGSWFGGSSGAGGTSVVGSTGEESLAGKSSIGTPDISPVEEPPSEPPLTKGNSDSTKTT